MYAVIKTGGKQYRVEEGDVIYIEKLDAAEGAQVSFDTLMLVDGQKVAVGKPSLGAKVTGSVEAHGKGEKIVIFKMKPKKNYRKKQGHRQPNTKVKITKIEA